MRTMMVLFMMIAQTLFVYAQEEETMQELQLEQLKAREENMTEDDGQWQLYEHRRHHPLRLNMATADDLQELQLLQPWQIRNFLLYRQTFGRLLSIYELQAIPGWDVETIQRIQPFVSIRESEAGDLPFLKRFREGEGSLLLRTGKWFAAGGPSSYVRYRYKCGRQLQWGITADKDAGESFFKGVQQQGFDFYSAHLFARRVGPLQVLALGDFQVNMGQGLIQWQGMNYAFSAVLGAKKQGEVLQPYSSAGEFNFHRGIGVTMGTGKLQVTAFISYRKLSAHLQNDSAGRYFTNFITSGYHRTLSEQEAKHTVKLLTTGASLRWRHRSLQLGLNAVEYRSSIAFRPPPAVYRLFAISGKQWGNASADYAFTIRNLHLFGEFAIDQRAQTAGTAGMLCSLLPALQLAVSYRYFSKQYQSLFSSAVSQGAAPSNEEGIALRLDWQLNRCWKLQAQTDIFRFPWLRYRVDAPANGYEHLLLMTWQPSRKISWQFRYQYALKPLNGADTFAVKYPGWQQRRQWRVQWSWEMGPRFTIRQRTDFLLAGIKGVPEESGVSLWLDASFKASRRWQLNARLHIYETGSYLSRVYSYERDVLYSYSMPAFAGNAIRSYVLTRYKLANKPGRWSAELWLKYAIAVRPSGLPVPAEEGEEIPQTDLRVQLMFGLR
ncbi:MAG: ComEA family DNA-binding protein [Pseudobacter sp.]|uniref:ComEA family DNA-binding protein n=1 Tax=Pseudobacter sp. TaxID=2045420 RepID=UPI003F80E601